jgi:hypothetical protein
VNWPLAQDTGNVDDPKPEDAPAAIPDAIPGKTPDESALRRIGAIADLVLSAGMPLVPSIAGWINDALTGDPAKLADIHSALDAVEQAVSQYKAGPQE